MRHVVVRQQSLLVVHERRVRAEEGPGPAVLVGRVPVERAGLHRRGYANVETVELQLNGRSLGTKSFDRKVTTFGRSYLETTEPTNDDYNYPSGSYTSPNGSTGKLHLTWTVPFEPGSLAAVGYSPSGAEVARDVVKTAGPARSLSLSAPSS